MTAQFPLKLILYFQSEQIKDHTVNMMVPNHHHFWLCGHTTLPVLSIAIGMVFPKEDSNVSAKCTDIILSVSCTALKKQQPQDRIKNDS